MSVNSSGVLLFRFRNGELQVMLVHPGGPFWEKKDEGAWSIPKGLIEEHEDSLDAARRELKEETGFEVSGKFIDLGKIKQPSKKIIHAWAFEKDLDETRIVSNRFALEWPKNSGMIKEYPEVNKAGWFNIDNAKKKLHKGQVGFIDRLMENINYAPNKQTIDMR
ncbi:MAG: NUDIX domain-containing protein [Methanotrichaceae archaeon]|nr:NUDIX domain-containing protein [Methanotrichaceae archaeon]